MTFICSGQYYSLPLVKANPSLLETLVVQLGRQSRGQKDLKVADSSQHGLVERTEERPELVQDLLSGGLGKVPAWA